ncbi:HEAT repeat domain-containing protein [Elusimicrobiota bacterium]
MNKRIIILSIAVFFIHSLSFAQTDELMDRAVKEYLRGDYIGAIQDFGTILDIEENKKAEQLLFQSLVEEGKRSLSSERYEEARGYFERAKKLNPEDGEVKMFLAKVKEKIGDKPTKIQAKPEPAVAVLKKQVTQERGTYKRKINSIAIERDKYKDEVEKNKKQMEEAKLQMEELRKSGQKSKTLLIIFMIMGGGVAIALSVFIILTLRNIYDSSSDSQYQLETIQEKIAQRLDETEKDSEDLEQRVARSINQMIEGQKDSAKQISHSVIGKTQEDIEEIKKKLEQSMEEQQTKLLELLNQQAKALASEETIKVEMQGEGGRKVITDVNPHVRARADGVEMIPKTISDPSIAEKMLKPYLGDPNNRVRGNACVAIYQYNPQLAIQALDKMASSPDKWMRLTAAWAVGEIGAPEMVDILRKLVDDIDEKVKDRAIRAFESLAEIKQDVGKEIRKMIRESKKKEEQ